MRTSILALLALAPALAQAQFPVRVQLTPAEEAIANPPRADRDFARINSQHKILVALIGYGVDYNHPLLMDNLHFDLENGQSVGLGRDYVTNDNWSSYRLIYTGQLGFDRQLPETRKEIEETSSREKWEQDRAKTVAMYSCTAESLLQGQPGVAAYSPLVRHHGAEAEVGATTGVAGIIGGGKPEIGIIPYRLGPYVRNQEENKDEGLGKRWLEMDNVKAAVEHAASRGVKVVYLPTVNFDSRPDDTASQVSRNGLVRFMLKKRTFADEYLALMKKHPEMVFVSMVAPNHGWTDDVSLIQYPCGLAAPNLVCTGPLNDRDVLEPNYEIPVNEDARLVFTRPTENKVLKPSDTCLQLAAVIDELIAAENEDSAHSALGLACSYDKQSGVWTKKPLSRALKIVLDEALQACKGSKNWLTGSDELSATERPAAQVTRALAVSWLAHPEISSGADLLNLVFEKDAKCERAGALKQCLIATEAPNWEKLRPGQEFSPPPSHAIAAPKKPASL